MGYVAPKVGPAGLTIPSYQDILDDNLQQFRNSFGANQYTGVDSAIYQFISVLSLKTSDVMKQGQYVYSQLTPTTAIGAGLDRSVKLNGIARKPYTYSTAVFTVMGTSGAVINNGVAQDSNGNQWLLPASVVITGGTVNVTAQCSSPGNITAEPNSITIIATPQSGWASVNNGSAAVPGLPVETDSQLRARQAISVALPSKTQLTGTIAAIAQTPGVTRYSVLENFTGSTDANGNPPHSITAVVEGGTNLAVATAIYNNKGIGALTNGDVSGSPTGETVTVNITDPFTGNITAIGFLTPAYVPIYVIANVHLLPGGTTATITAIQAAITAYLNSLQIGEIVTYSGLIAAAMAVTPNLSAPLFSIHTLFFATTATPTTITDIVVGFQQVSQGISGNITVNSI